MEVDKIRYIEDAPPGNRTVRIQVPFLKLNLGMIGNYPVVAVEALLYRRQTGVLPPLDIGMAKATIDLFDPRMDPMAEIDRLDRAYAALRVEIGKIEHDSDKKGSEDCPDQSPSDFWAGPGRLNHFFPSEPCSLLLRLQNSLVFS